MQTLKGKESLKMYVGYKLICNKISQISCNISDKQEKDGIMYCKVYWSRLVNPKIQANVL